MGTHLGGKRMLFHAIPINPPNFAMLPNYRIAIFVIV